MAKKIIYMKRNKFIIGQLICLGLACVFSSCEEKKEINCDQDVIISQTEYENAPNDSFSIIEMKIIDDCLKIKFGASGCGGNSWIVKLIDLGVVAESNPCQRTLRLSLDNKEMCFAYITKEISFNIEDLQIQGDNKVLLNISGKQMLYEY